MLHLSVSGAMAIGVRRIQTEVSVLVNHVTLGLPIAVFVLAIEAL